MHRDTVLSMPEERIAYKRSRFRTRLPADRLYTPSHCWLLQKEDQLWQVGYTKFAMRMLGEVVEFDFEVKAQEEIELGAVIGWLEGFKATSDVYSVINGSFVGANDQIEDDPSLMHSKMYDEGWFYEARGEADPDAMDVHAYASLLDETIDKMQEHMQ